MRKIIIAIHPQSSPSNHFLLGNCFYQFFLSTPYIPTQQPTINHLPNRLTHPPGSKHIPRCLAQPMLYIIHSIVACGNSCFVEGF